MVHTKEDSESTAEQRMKQNLQRFLSQQPEQHHQQQLQLQEQHGLRLKYILPSAPNSRTRFRMGSLTGRKVSFKYDRESFLDHAVELIDPELRPVPPQPSCPDSMIIYNQHRLMAGDFLKVQNELSELKHHKLMLEEKLKMLDLTAHKSERELTEKVLQLQAEKDSLTEFHKQLSNQLQMVKTPIQHSILTTSSR